MKKIKQIQNNVPLYILAIIIICHIIYSYHYKYSIFINKNSLITLFVWLVTLYFTYTYKNNYILLIPIVLLLINELLYYAFNMDIFDGPSRTKMFYDMTTLKFTIADKYNSNLTEGMYLKNLNDDNSVMTIEEAKRLDPKEADTNKYKKMFLELNIPTHDYKNIKVLDIGCGHGNFIKYCKSIGIEATGLSISQQQIIDLKNQGLDVHLGSYRELQEQFIKKYDIITFWGSLEHITNSYPCSESGTKKATEMLEKIFTHCKQYYKPTSPYKYVFTTTLHMNKNVCNTLDVYIIERAYSGWYFYDEPGKRLGEQIEKYGFKQKKIKNDDYTYHYYLASKIDPLHFGLPGDINLTKTLVAFSSIFVNPQLLAMVIYVIAGKWMWQFDGKSHYGQSCLDCEFNKDRKTRPTTLIWTFNKLVD
jgi:cyclopropane fatty-acyl-phospholipid synthase-like methyltransferase